MKLLKDGVVTLIEAYSMLEFVNLFYENKGDFACQVGDILQRSYINDLKFNNGKPVNDKIKILLYLKDCKYIGFQTYEIKYHTLHLCCIYVEEAEQNKGVGFKLSDYAIINGLNGNCEIVSATIGKSSEALINKLIKKYSDIKFDITYKQLSWLDNVEDQC